MRMSRRDPSFTQPKLNRCAVGPTKAPTFASDNPASYSRTASSLAPEDVPVTSDERRFLDERLRDLEEHPDAERPWEAVRADIYARLK